MSRALISYRTGWIAAALLCTGCQVVIPTVRTSPEADCGCGAAMMAPASMGADDAEVAGLRAPHSKFHPVPTRPVFEAKSAWFAPTPELAPDPWHGESLQYPPNRAPEEIQLPEHSRPLEQLRPATPDPSAPPAGPGAAERPSRVTLNPPETRHLQPAQIRWLETQ